MKKEIIIFKDQKPTKEEICHSIEHFCMDHSIDCICVTRRDRILYKIDGELYQTKIQEDHLDQPSYWMIILLFKQIIIQNFLLFYIIHQFFEMEPDVPDMGLTAFHTS